MKVDELYKEVENTFNKHQEACRKLTDYISDKIVKDMKDYEFYTFSVICTYADGVALCMDIEKDKKNKIDPFHLGYGASAVVCNLKNIISMYKQEKRKITIKEIFDNRF